MNNAGNFYAGFFEEVTPEDFRAQIETNLFGPVNVTRAVLPLMRAQRSGLRHHISSTAGIVGQEFTSAYAASKFAVEGWIESLTPEVAPFGIRTMLVEPGFFRTDLLTNDSTIWPEPTIDDYADRTRQTVDAWQGMNGKQGGDPAKLAAALVRLAGQPDPPHRWVAGADAVAPSSRRPGTCSPRPAPTGRSRHYSRTTSCRHRSDDRWQVRGTLEAMDLTTVIETRPGVRSGKPCFIGTRIAVYDVLEYLASGMTTEEIVADFPELTPELVRVAIEFAALRERRLATA